MLVSFGFAHLLVALSLSLDVAAAAGQRRQIGSLLTSLGLGGSATTGLSSSQASISISVSLPQVLPSLLPSASEPSSQAPRQDTSGLPPRTASELLPSQVTSSPSTSAPITSSASIFSSTPSPGNAIPSSTSAARTSTQASSTTARATTFTTPLVSNEVRSTVYRTVFTSNGAAITSSVSANSTIAHTTGYATVTSTPALNESGSGGSSSNGLSSSSKKVIGGVVGGVGGAIFLGAIAAVAWRLRRKRNIQPDPYGYNNKEDFSSGPSSHYPSGHDAVTNPIRVNQSSNF